MTETNTFRLKIISQEGIFYEGEAVMLELHTTEGEVGIYKNHMPVTCVIAPGLMTITESESSRKEAAIAEGFIRILQEEILILAEEVHWQEGTEKNVDSYFT